MQTEMHVNVNEYPNVLDTIQCARDPSWLQWPPMDIHFVPIKDDKEANKREMGNAGTSSSAV